MSLKVKTSDGSEVTIEQFLIDAAYSPHIAKGQIETLEDELEVIRKSYATLLETMTKSGNKNIVSSVLKRTGYNFVKLVDPLFQNQTRKEPSND